MFEEFILWFWPPVKASLELLQLSVALAALLQHKSMGMFPVLLSEGKVCLG